MKSETPTESARRTCPVKDGIAEAIRLAGQVLVKHIVAALAEPLPPATC